MLLAWRVSHSPTMECEDGIARINAMSVVPEPHSSGAPVLRPMREVHARREKIMRKAAFQGFVRYGIWQANLSILAMLAVILVPIAMGRG